MKLSKNHLLILYYLYKANRKVYLEKIKAFLTILRNIKGGEKKCHFGCMKERNVKGVGGSQIK